MRSAAPALLPIFRSQLQADILAALLLNPGRECSLTELAKRFGAPLSTVHGEVKRLTQAGLLLRRDVGRSAVVRANSRNRLVGFRPFADLRRRRNELEYPRLPANTSTYDESRQAVEVAESLIEVASKLLGQLSFFVE